MAITGIAPSKLDIDLVTIVISTSFSFSPKGVFVHEEYEETTVVFPFFLVLRLDSWELLLLLSD